MPKRKTAENEDKLNKLRGVRLRECRNSINMIQNTLAEKTGYSDGATISDCERGIKGRSLDWEKARLFSKVLGVSAEYLMCESNFKSHEDRILAFNNALKNDFENSIQKKEVLLSYALSTFETYGFVINPCDNFEEYDQKYFEVLFRGKRIGIWSMDRIRKLISRYDRLVNTLLNDFIEDNSDAIDDPIKTDIIRKAFLDARY